MEKTLIKEIDHDFGTKMNIFVIKQEKDSLFCDCIGSSSEPSPIFFELPFFKEGSKNKMFNNLCWTAVLGRKISKIIENVFCFQIKKVYPELNIKLPGKRRLGNNFDPGKTVVFASSEQAFCFLVNTWYVLNVRLQSEQGERQGKV